MTTFALSTNKPQFASSAETRWKVIRARAGLDLRGPHCFSNYHFFVPNDCIFHSLNMPQNLPNLEYTSHLPKKSSSISTTRWPYKQGKCVLANNSHTLCCTFKNLISMHSLNCAESCHIGHSHFHLNFFFSQIHKMKQTYFFKLLSGDFTDLHQTLHTASLDSPDKK